MIKIKSVNQGQRGFTLIELVMVIVLLGILAATAIPRFADLAGNANAAVFKAVQSNFKTGVNLVHSLSLISRGVNGYPDVSLEGFCIIVDSASGYPKVDQITGTCTPVALNYPIRYQPLPYSPLPFQSLPLPTLEHMFAFIKQSTFFVSKAYAVPPAPPPPPPLSNTELPSLLIDNKFIDWVWTKTPPTGKLSSPDGFSFNYNQNNGNVN